METKFNRGDKVRIKSCPIFKSVEGKSGTIVRVRVAKNGERVDGKTIDGELSLYKVRVGKLYVPGYATDDCLEPCGKTTGRSKRGADSTNNRRKESV